MQKAKSPKRGPGKAANRKAVLSAQQTIPYLVMHPDGVCQLPGGLYTKTVEYEDINYSVASTEDQTAIFGGWSSFLNYFDSSLPFQLSFINRRSRSRSRYKVNIPPAQDDFDSIRAEFTGMLLAVLAVALVGGGAAFYFKVLRPKQQKAAAPQEDYGDELTDYDEPDGYGDEDDDGPPWDEEDDDGEEADK